jgi:hypothetical protein
LLILMTSCAVTVGLLVYWWSYQNQNTLVLLFVGILLLGSINFLYLRLREISIESKEIVFKNIFGSLRVPRNEVVGVKKNFLSPFLFSILLRNSSEYYFIPESKVIFNSILTMSSGNAVENINQLLSNWKED